MNKINIKYFDYVISILFFVLLFLRSSNFKYLVSSSVFYFLIVLINIYLLLNHKQKINKHILFLYFICFLSWSFNYLIGTINPFFNSFERLILFFLTLNVLGPFLINKRSFQFRNRLFKTCLVFIPMCFLIDSFYIIKDRKITFGGEFNGILESPNLAGVICSLHIIIFIFLYLREKKLKNKILYMAISFSAFPFLFASGARGPILSLIIVLLIISFYNFKKIIPFGIIICLTGLVFYNSVYKYVEPIINKIESRSGSGDISTGRFSMYSDNIDDFMSNPIIGVGFYNMVHTYNSKINPDGSIEYPSGWLFVLSTTGILGFVFFINLLFKVFISFFKIRNTKFPFFLTLLILCFFLIHSNIEGYIFSGGGMLFCIFWLTVSNFYNFYINENSSNISRR